MAQSYDRQSGDLDDAERARLEQEEMARQLGAAPNAASQPAADPSSLSDPSKFTQGYAQRGGSGALGGAASGALNGAGTGATIGSIVPGVGTAIGAGAGAIAGAVGSLFNRHADSAKTDYAVDDARKAITDAYTEYNGHAPTAEE